MTGCSLIVVAAATLLGPSLAADCRPPGPDSPRTLILALDGMPYRVVERAREQGAFEGWPETRQLVSTFPSMTNVAFTAMLEPFGLSSISGYEVRYFNKERNRIIGDPLGPKVKEHTWRDVFHVTSKGSKVAMYTSTRKQVWRTMDKVERLVLAPPGEVMLAHVGATDALAHFRGDKALLEVMIEMEERLESLQRLHLETHGRPLDLVLLSDHGNTAQKVRHCSGLRRMLRDAGFRVTQRLERPGDVVAPTYGVVSYGVLFLDPEQAETAARTVADHAAVDLAAWMSGPSVITVLSKQGDAELRWHDGPRGRRYLYRPRSADPLRLEKVSERLAADGRTDEGGFASADDWLELSSAADFPDAPQRLVDSLAGTIVENVALVIFSVTPGYALGLKTSRLGAMMKGGHLEGTHGGLDRESSLGFFLTSRPIDSLPAVIRPDGALSRWATVDSCVAATPVVAPD
jgi:hypothetical protein